MAQEICELTQVHEDAVTNVQQQMPDLAGVAKFLKALSDETRLKIAYALTVEEELCVCDVAEIIGASVATASHHLRYLKDHQLAKSQRKGKQMYYALADEHVYQIVTIAYEHVKEGIADDNVQAGV
ncbi:ArsR/SmtB family transcription factor [Lysinibacillus piscis]|uniref:Transcriptional regulator n=1 Tax=Lysinibacillus piscis TaxID=2518931 RepID=A0ABQ5NMT9_9BACI|nr:metalloregulator ArsR/SmtB family transcription factor [Lysinibacillus sp. KH24]GLC89433.1 transcriptional regulator [Lysinibacillus sp. KH24]